MIVKAGRRDSRRLIPGTKGTASPGRILVAACLASSLAAASGAAASEATTQVADPAVTGPVEGGLRGRPWSGSLFDLAPFGYVEEEYFIEGSAISHGPETAGEAAPYKTRIVVRRPVDPDDFNGTVVLEWLNVSGTVDIEFMWVYGYELFLREGYAFVGVSAQEVAVDGGPQALKFWDPVRYGSLSHPGDDWSFDIFSQAAQAVRAPGGTLALGGLAAERLLATGTSQSGGLLVRYANNVQNQAQVFDGFLVHSGDGIVRGDVGVPVFKVMSPGDDPREPQGDTARFRFWEEAGSAHSVHYWWDYGRHVLVRDLGSPIPVGEIADPMEACPVQMNTYPRQYVARAAFVHLDKWVRSGKAPPVSDRLVTDETGAFVLDEHGNHVGGLRLPTLDVPVATYTPDGGCLINHGTTVPFSVEKLRALYPTRESYVSAVKKATARAVKNGFLLPKDAEEVRAQAAAFDVWE